MLERAIWEELRLDRLAIADVPAIQTTMPMAMIHRKRRFFRPASPKPCGS